MRIPFPERVPLDRVAAFVVALFLVQTLEGTPIYFSAGCAAFFLLSAIAFNTGGGLTRAAGAYVFFYSVLVFDIGVVYKALIGEPGQTNLRDPETTIAVYVAGMAAMLAATVVSRRFTRRTGLLQNVLREGEMYRSSIGCMVFGFGGPWVIYLLAPNLGSTFTQLNQLLPLAIIIGVIYELRVSGGTRSMNIPIGLTIVYQFVVFGVLGFSKQGMLEPFYCWMVPVAAMRYRLNRMQVIFCALGIFVTFYYLVPFSQYGRNFVDRGNTLHNIPLAIRLLEHPEELRKNNEEMVEEASWGAHYYDHPEGFWDRLQFIAADDSLIDVTDQGHVFGLFPIRASFINVIPHFLYHDKPVLNFGNQYAHEIGALPAEDTTTGISFSPTAEAFHIERWIGLTVVAPILWFMAFTVFDVVIGDLRATPWGLLGIAVISHAAPETALTGVVALMTFGVEILTFCALFSTWVAPTIAIAVLGRDRRREERLTWFGNRGASRLPS